MNSSQHRTVIMSRRDMIVSKVLLNVTIAEEQTGSVLEEDVNLSGVQSSGAASTQDPDLQEDDEGIDINGIVQETVQRRYIMSPVHFCMNCLLSWLHSGSAPGGYYYAYIKDFECSQSVRECIQFKFKRSHVDVSTNET